MSVNRKYSFQAVVDGAFELVVDAVYEGGSLGHAGDDPLPKMFRGVGTSGGFRVVKTRGARDGVAGIAYVILYTSGEETEWPDRLDVETGAFTYYGDNRHPGRRLHDTPKKGNVLLREVYGLVHGTRGDRGLIPPFLVFQKTGEGRSVRFLGLAAPGHPNLAPGEDLVALWRRQQNARFQNYRAEFTILDTGDVPVSRTWLTGRREGQELFEAAPDCW